MTISPELQLAITDGHPPDGVLTSMRTYGVWVDFLNRTRAQLSQLTENQARNNLRRRK